jgi:putative NADH-flavin reductase
MPPTHVALVGAAGNIGPPILHALLSASHTVTVLTRHGSSSTSKLPSHPKLDIKSVDLTSAASIAPAFAGVEVVVSCVAAAALGLQNPLIDAAVQAGVKRFIPAEFGLDSANKKTMELPVIQPKVATQKYLNEKIKQTGPRFSWTAVANGWFLDWVLQSTPILMDVKEKKATLYNGGDVKFSTALLSDIAKAVVGIIEKQEETRNRVVYVQSAVVTQNQLIGYAKEKVKGEWSTTFKGTEDMLAELADAVDKRDFDRQFMWTPILGCSDTEYGCDYTGHADNELFGIKEMSEEELRALVWSTL